MTKETEVKRIIRELRAIEQEGTYHHDLEFLDYDSKPAVKRTTYDIMSFNQLKKLIGLKAKKQLSIEDVNRNLVNREVRSNPLIVYEVKNGQKNKTLTLLIANGVGVEKAKYNFLYSNGKIMGGANEILDFILGLIDHPSNGLIHCGL